jgi:hypothetical protein
VAQLQKGLDQLASLPDNSRRQALELNLQITLGPALIATRGYSSPEAGDTFARASTLVERLNRSDYDVALLYGLCGYHVVRSEYRLALPLAASPGADHTVASAPVAISQTYNCQQARPLPRPAGGRKRRRSVPASSAQALI